MFGLTIVNADRYKSLVAAKKENERVILDLSKKCNRLESDNDSLREQLNGEIEKRKDILREVDNLRLRLEQLKKDAQLELVKIKNDAEARCPAVLSDFYILHENDYPCDRCQLNGPYCKKIRFANHSICIIPKEYVNSFRDSLEKRINSKNKK